MAVCLLVSVSGLPPVVGLVPRDIEASKLSRDFLGGGYPMLLVWLQGKPLPLTVDKCFFFFFFNIHC